MVLNTVSDGAKYLSEEYYTWKFTKALFRGKLKTPLTN